MAYLEGAEGLSFVHAESQEVGHDPYKEKYAQLVKDYAEYRLPQKVTELAAQIYMTVMRGIVRKRGRRRAMMCKCIWEAYKQNNVCKDPVLLARQFGIDMKQFRKAQDEFYDLLHEANLYATFPRKQMEAADLLTDLSQHMGLKEIPFATLKDIIETLHQRSTLLHRTASRDIAVAVLHWYACETGNKRSFEVTQGETLVPKAKLVKNVATIAQIMTDGVC